MEKEHTHKEIELRSEEVQEVMNRVPASVNVPVKVTTSTMKWKSPRFSTRWPWCSVR